MAGAVHNSITRRFSPDDDIFHNNGSASVGVLFGLSGVIGEVRVDLERSGWLSAHCQCLGHLRCPVAVRRTPRRPAKPPADVTVLIIRAQIQLTSKTEIAINFTVRHRQLILILWSLILSLDSMSDDPFFISSFLDVEMGQKKRALRSKNWVYHFVKLATKTKAIVLLLYLFTTESRANQELGFEFYISESQSNTNCSKKIHFCHFNFSY